MNLKNLDDDLDFYLNEDLSPDVDFEREFELEQEKEFKDNFDSILEEMEEEIRLLRKDTLTENELEKLYETIEGDELIADMANDLGLLDNPLNEDGGVGVNHVNLSYQAKLNRVVTQSSMILAKEANDIMYTKYVRFNRLRLSLKKQIIQKYGPRAQGRARQVIAQRQREKSQPKRPTNNNSAVQPKVNSRNPFA